jgi:drug/metabolite transporter (DMT)-like permease
MKASLIKLHIAVLLAGFTGVLGVLITLNEGLLVWYRIFITVVTLAVLLIARKQLEKISFASIIKLLLIGFLIALHWACFYGSIKYSNVSIGLICIASVGVFTAILEPMLTTKKFSTVEILLGLMCLFGIYLIFHFDSRYRTGIIIGIVSAILAASFSVLNKKYVQIASSKTMMFYELIGGLIILTTLMPFYLKLFPTQHILPSVSDFLWLLILSWLCTVLAMDLFLQALQKVSAFTQNLTLNLEPVYGILLAFAIYNENKYLNNSFYAGISLIAVSVVIQMIRIVKLRKH